MLPLLFLATALQSTSSITVSNHADGDTIRYPVALLEGTSPSTSVSVSAGSFKSSVATVKGRYKILVELKPGRNEVHLGSRSETKTLVMNYQPVTTQYKVNVVLVRGSDEKEAYDTLLPTDSQNFDEKIDTVLKLMQTFTAESMNRAGYGRLTFGLDLDANGKVKVNRVTYPLPGSALRERDGNTLWDNFYGWIDKQFPMETNKNLVIMAFSGFNREKKKAEGHTALGGGGMGLFSSVGTWTWPNTLQDTYRAFSDSETINADLITDDSAFRTVKWGVAATTIGAMLHEMGHSFGLPHTGDPTSIMQRGFDRFNRMFLLVEQPSKRNEKPIEFTDADLGRFEPRAAAQLATSPWFQPDPLRFTSTEGPKVRVEGDELVVESPNGIGAAIFMPSRDEVKDDGAYKAFLFDGFPKNRPTLLRYKLSFLKEKNTVSQSFRVLVLDSAGRQIEREQKRIGTGG